jgi:hypothetical protein
VILWSIHGQVAAVQLTPPEILSRSHGEILDRIVKSSDADGHEYVAFRFIPIVLLATVHSMRCKTKCGLIDGVRMGKFSQGYKVHHIISHASSSGWQTSEQRVPLLNGNFQNH